MSLFDRFKAAATPMFNRQQALMTIVVAAVKADGEVAKEEITRLRAMCALSPIFASNTPDQDAAVISFADNVTTQLKEQAITRATEALSPDLRETAFAFACDMILADGILGADEEKFISDLATQIGIREDVGQAIIMATLVRNRAET